MAAGQNANIDQIITNAIQSISRLREMQPGTTTSTSSQQPSPTMASEVVRLFLTLQSQSSMLPNIASGSGACGRQVNQCASVSRRRNARPRPAPYPVKRKNKKSKPVHKDIVLILNPSVIKVPTHKKRLKLESQGRVIHDFAFDRDWNEEELRCLIEQEMPILINQEYEFLKVECKQYA